MIKEILVLKFFFESTSEQNISLKKQVILCVDIFMNIL